MDEIDFKEKLWCNSHVLLAGVFIFYGLSYYGILKIYWRCDRLPPFAYVLMLLLLHLGQAYLVLMFHERDQKAYALMVGFLPLILLFFFLRYQKTITDKHEEQLKKALQEQKLKQKMKEQQQLAQLDQPVAMGPDKYFNDPSVSPEMKNQAMYMYQQQHGGSILNSNTVPAYGDYVSQFDQSKTMGFGSSCKMGNF